MYMSLALIQKNMVLVSGDKLGYQEYSKTLRTWNRYMGLFVYSREDRLGYQKHPNTVCLVIHNSGDNQESP